MAQRLRMLGPVSSFLGASLLLASAAQARVGGVVVRWGEVDAQVTGPMSDTAELKALSEGQTIADPRFTRTTDQMEARLCSRFGVQAWLAAGLGEAVPLQVGVTVRHPLLTRLDGATSMADSFYTPVIDGEVGAYFEFENGWEMQPGTWIFEFHAGEQLITSKSFTVTPPAPGTLPQSVCRGAPVS